MVSNILYCVIFFSFPFPMLVIKHYANTYTFYKEIYKPLSYIPSPKFSETGSLCSQSCPEPVTPNSTVLVVLFVCFI